MERCALEGPTQSQRKKAASKASEKQWTMGQHWLLVCAVALATDVAPEIEELARRRLSKVGVVFLEDDDAVNIQSTSVQINRLPPSAWTLT